MKHSGSPGRPANSPAHDRKARNPRLKDRTWETLGGGEARKTLQPCAFRSSDRSSRRPGDFRDDSSSSCTHPGCGRRRIDGRRVYAAGRRACRRLDHRPHRSRRLPAFTGTVSKGETPHRRRSPGASRAINYSISPTPHGGTGTFNAYESYSNDNLGGINTEVFHRRRRDGKRPAVGSVFDTYSFSYGPTPTPTPRCPTVTVDPPSPIPCRRRRERSSSPPLLTRPMV